MTHRPNQCLMLLMIALLVAGTSALAQTRRGAGGMLRSDLDVQREVFPPELVMRFQSEIDLSDEQEKLLISEMQSLQSDLVPLQFEMNAAAGDLRQALAGARVEEEETLALAERLMSLEGRIKQRHLTLMIRIKNALTPEQQEQLRQLRDDLREQFRERRGDRNRGPRDPGQRPGGPRS